MKKQKVSEMLTKFSPNSFVFIFCFILLAMVLTYLVPAGSYDTVENAAGQTVIAPDSFQYLPQTPVNPGEMFVCIVQAFCDNASLIFCILFAYCFVGILVKNNVFHVLVVLIIRKLKNRVNLVLPIVILVFGLLGSVAGLAEEVFGLFPVCISLALALGYDEIVGGSIVYLAVFTGFASATFNPFTVGIAQAIAGVPLYSGLLFRVGCFAIFMGILIAYVMGYAAKIKKDPRKSLLYDPSRRSEAVSETELTDTVMTLRQTLCLLLFVAVMALVVTGSVAWGWYIPEIAAIFLAAGIAAGFLSGWNPGELADNYVKIGSETLFSMLIIGLSNAICVIMEKGHITDTIVHGCAGLLENTSGYVSAVLMLLVQNFLNFFIPSGPGQAAVSMPIMSALADVTGLSRQLAVLAFQFGDGYSNIFWPTMVCMMCGIMKIPVAKWYRYLTPLFGIMFAAQVVLILAAVAIGY